MNKFDKLNEEIVEHINNNLPDEVTDPRTGKTYKKGVDYRFEIEFQAICPHLHLDKLGFGYYICPNCKLILNIPFSMQYKHDELMENWSAIAEKLKTYYGTKNHKSKPKKA